MNDDKEFPSDSTILRSQIWEITKNLWEGGIQKKVDNDDEIIDDELESMIGSLFNEYTYKELEHMILPTKEWKNYFNSLLNLFLHRFWKVNVLLYDTEGILIRTQRFINPEYKKTVHLIYESDHYDATQPIIV